MVFSVEKMIKFWTINLLDFRRLLMYYIAITGNRLNAYN